MKDASKHHSLYFPGKIAPTAENWFHFKLEWQGQAVRAATYKKDCLIPYFFFFYLKHLLCIKISFFKKYIFRTSHIKLLDFIRVEIKYVGRSVRPKWSHTVESTIVQSFIFLSKTVSFRLSYVILLLINIFFSGTFYLLFGDYTLFKCKTICFFLGMNRILLALKSEYRYIRFQIMF